MNITLNGQLFEYHDIDVVDSQKIIDQKAKMFFGIDRNASMTLNEIAHELDLSSERIRQIVQKVLEK